MQLVTPRNIVQQHFFGRQPNDAYLEEAVDKTLCKGWAFSHYPDSGRLDQEVAIAKSPDHLVLLMQMTYEASRDADSRSVELPRGMAEVRAGSLMPNPEFGQQLARRGLLMAGHSETTVSLQGSTPAIALLVNESRYFTRSRGRLAETIVQAALGHGRRPKSVSASDIEEAGQVFAKFGISLAVTSQTNQWIRLRSSWQIPGAGRKPSHWGNQ